MIAQFLHVEKNYHIKNSPLFARKEGYWTFCEFLNKGKNSRLEEKHLGQY